MIVELNEKEVEALKNVLSEAKEILEKKGYRLVEDAYTDAMDAEDDEVLRNVQIKSKINELVNLLKKTNYFKNNEIEQKMEVGRYVLGGTGEKCYIEARVVWDFDQWRIKFYLKIDDKFVKLYYSNDLFDFIEDFDTEWEEVKTDIEHTINYKNRAKTKLGNFTNVFRDKYFDDLEEAKEILKKNGFIVESTANKNNVITKLIARMKESKWKYEPEPEMEADPEIGYKFSKKGMTIWVQVKPKQKEFVIDIEVEYKSHYDSYNTIGDPYSTVDDIVDRANSEYKDFADEYLHIEKTAKNKNQ